MPKYLDNNGLLYFWQKIKNAFAGKNEAVKTISRSGTTFTATRADGTTFTFDQQDNDTTYTPASVAPLMDGTAAVGTSVKYAREDHVHPSDTSRVPTSRTVNGHALSANVTVTKSDVGLGNVDNTADADKPISTATQTALDDKVDKVTGKGLSTNDFTDTLKTKLDGIATGAEVNQNAFSNVKVGTTTIAADGKTDTLELVAGSNVTITPDATNDKVTIEATDTTYSNVVADGASGLMSGTDKTKLDGIAAGATVDDHKWNNVELSKTASTWTSADVLVPILNNNSATTATLMGATHTPSASPSAHGNVGLARYSDGRLFSLTPTNSDNSTKVATTAFVKNLMGANNGIATLDANGLIPSDQLPSYVDDVIEAYEVTGSTELGSGWLSATSGGAALTPETGKIYVLMADSTSGTYSANAQFRWSGTTYVKLSDGGVSAITNAEIDVIVAS